MTWEVLIFVFGGTFFGAFLGPLMLDEYRNWREERLWKTPRKKLLRAKLESAPNQGWVSLEVLTRLTGTTEDQCRTLLIEIGARGGSLRSKKEGWALISRRPLEGPAQEEDG